MKRACVGVLLIIEFSKCIAIQ